MPFESTVESPVSPLLRAKESSGVNETDSVKKTSVGKDSISIDLYSRALQSGKILIYLVSVITA